MLITKIVYKNAYTRVSETKGKRQVKTLRGAPEEGTFVMT